MLHYRWISLRQWLQQIVHIPATPAFDWFRLSPTFPTWTKIEQVPSEAASWDERQHLRYLLQNSAGSSQLFSDIKSVSLWTIVMKKCYLWLGISSSKNEVRSPKAFAERVKYPMRNSRSDSSASKTKVKCVGVLLSQVKLLSYRMYWGIDI